MSRLFRVGKALLDDVLFLLRCRMQKLEASEIVQFDYMPKELVTYSKDTQTPVAPKLPEGKTQYSVHIQDSHLGLLLLIPLVKFASYLLTLFY